MLSLNDAKAALKGAENRVNFSKGWAGMGGSVPIEHLVDLVERDPSSWMNSFPTCLKNYKNLSKPKTAFLEMLKLDAVREALGKERADRVAALVVDVWKTHRNTILEARKPAPDRDRDREYDEVMDADADDATNGCDDGDCPAHDDKLVSSSASLLDKLVELGVSSKFSETYFVTLANIHADLERSKVVLLALDSLRSK